MDIARTVKMSTLLTARHFVPYVRGRFVERPDGSMRKLSFSECFLGTALPRYEEIKRDKRIIKDKVVTDAFVNKIVDGLQAAAYINNWKYHDSGTGVGAEAASDTTLGTPCGEARDVGTQVEGATANVYKSVATHTYAGTFAITEHGLFDATTAGTLMDRTKFAAINVVANDKIEFTFTITFSSGG